MKTNNLNADSRNFDASSIFFQEDFLHYLWKYKLFAVEKLHTIYKEKITLVSVVLTIITVVLIF